MSKQFREVGVLPIVYEDLHASREVSWVAEQSTEKLPNDRLTRIGAYLTRLEDAHGLLGGTEDRKIAQIQNIVGEDATPMQLESFERWVDYINSDDANYPVWFRYFAIRSLTKMATFDGEKSRFKTRSKTTRDPYPELNPEALALAYSRLNDGEIAGFNSMYSTSVMQLEHQSKQFETDKIEGVWKKYNKEPRGTNEESKKLSNSLQGFNTTWCTATGSAPNQLAHGDFYVFYSDNGTGENVVPRLAIRMIGNKVAEIRGVDKSYHQGVEPELYDTLVNYLETLELEPDDTKRLHKLRSSQQSYDRIANGDITSADIEEAYLSARRTHRIYAAREPDHFVGLDTNEEMRIAAIKNATSFIPAMQQLFEVESHTDIAKALLQNYPVGVFASNLSNFKDLKIDVLEDYVLGSQDVRNINEETFDLSRDHTEIAAQILGYGQASAFCALLPYLKGINPEVLTLDTYLLKTGHINEDTFDLSGNHTKIAAQILKHGQYKLFSSLLPYLRGVELQTLIDHNIDLNFIHITEHTFNLSEDHTEIARQLLDNGYTSLFYKLMPHLNNIDITIFNDYDVNKSRITQQLESFRLTNLESTLPFINVSLSNDHLGLILCQFNDDASQYAILSRLLPDAKRMDIHQRVTKLTELVSEDVRAKIFIALAKLTTNEAAVRRLFTKAPENLHIELLSTVYSNGSINLKRLIKYVSTLDPILQIHLAKIASQDGKARRIIASLPSFSSDAQPEIASVASEYSSRTLKSRTQRYMDKT
jgi:hypothetical protein